jgi:arsenate reductase
MTSVKLYHNPRCSKSRQTLELLVENSIDPEIILYLETQPSAEEIKNLASMIGVSVREIIRTGEDEYSALSLDEESTDDQLADAAASSPILLQRPIVVNGDKARVGRPPESVLELFNGRP